jgi:Nuclease A inhibitor-like protein
MQHGVEGTNPTVLSASGIYPISACFDDHYCRVTASEFEENLMPTVPAIDPDAAFFTGAANRLALALATLVVDQMLTSESDRPFEPFTAAFAVGRRVTARALLEALRFEPTRRADVSSATGFFERARATAAEAGDRQGELALAVLETTMRRTLGPIHQLYVRGDGVVEVPFYVFGRLAGGPLVGLRSIAIET